MRRGQERNGRSRCRHGMKVGNPLIRGEMMIRMIHEHVLMNDNDTSNKS